MDSKLHYPILTDVLTEDELNAILNKPVVIDMSTAFSQGIVRFDYSDADIYVAPPPPEPQPEVIIRAKKIVVVKPTFQRSQITCHGFDWQNLELCEQFLNKNIELHIEDDNGLFAPRTPQRITAFKVVGNKLLISTENQ